MENELTRARHLTGPGTLLMTFDADLRQLARLAGQSDPYNQPDITLTTDAVERTFDRWIAVVHGHPVAGAGLPSDSRFAATLLILRELMHHLQFESIQILRC